MPALAAPRQRLADPQHLEVAGAVDRVSDGLSTHDHEPGVLTAAGVELLGLDLVQRTEVPAQFTELGEMVHRPNTSPLTGGSPAGRRDRDESRESPNWYDDAGPGVDHVELRTMTSDGVFS